MTASGFAYTEGFNKALNDAELRRLAEPRDETETLATCPKCACMGHHAVEVVEFQRRRLPDLDDGWIDCSGFGDPRAGTRMAKRTCMFCGHSWERQLP
jgi:hypothetical protein